MVHSYRRYSYVRTQAETSLILKRTVYHYTMIIKVNDASIRGTTIELPTGSLAVVEFDYEEAVRGGTRTFGDTVDGDNVFTTVILTAGI